MNPWETAAGHRDDRDFARVSDGVDVSRAPGEHRQVPGVPAVERHLDDRFIIDDLADVRRLRLDEWRSGGDLDALVHVADFESDIQADGLVDGQHDPFSRHGAEAAVLDG
jgi:hypothetical protein